MRRPRRLLHRVLTIAIGAIVLGSVAVPVAGAAPSATNALSGRTLGGTRHTGNGHKRGSVDVRRLPKSDDTGRATTSLNLPSPSAAESRSRRPAAPTGTQVVPEPVQAGLTANPAAGKPGFAGLSRTSGPATNVDPPDPWVAAGPDHIVQTTNVSMRITNRTGGSASSVDLASFFILPGGYENTDPRVMYDSLHGRWIATEVSWICSADDNNPYAYVDLMLSRTADPNGIWDLYFWEFSGYLPDFAGLGDSTTLIGVGANMFTMPEGFSSGCMGQAGVTYVGAEILIFDWADLLADGGPNGFVDTFDVPTDETYITPRVARQAPATSSVLHVMMQSAGVALWQPFYLGITGSVVADTIDGVNLGDLFEEGIMGAYFEPPDPQQPGPDTITTAIDSRPTDAVWINNRLAVVSTVGCTPAGDSTVRDCVRVTELNTTNVSELNLPTLTQDFLIAGSGKDNYYGGIGFAQDGALHVVWSRSSTLAGDYPSSVTSYHLPSDDANDISPVEVLQAGTGAYAGNRWGDYVGVAQDPQVPNAVWQGNEYSAGGTTWATYVSQLQTGGSSYTPIAPLRIVDSRINLGVSGVFATGVPKTFNVAGAGGGTIPDGAVAVTGNVTVTGQTAAGFVALTPNPTSTPPSSTINFPLGDTRANNFTIPLNASGDLAAVLKTSAAGKTGHVIVDITGYFVLGDGEATYATIAPVRVMDTRAGAGHVGPLDAFSAGVTQTLSIAGANDIPVNATAITGNLTVTGQARAGYLSVTPEDPPGTPTSSTLNFPLGDTRANGLTAALNVDGDLSITYVTSSGTGTTHVLLDVTGYYVPDNSGLLFFPLTPGRILDTRAGVVLSGLSGVFATSVPRTLDTDGHWGVPVGAEAITGNLTVVGQTSAGFVSGTPTEIADPTTSTLNFPLGDVRANGVTLPLDSGNQAFVYKTSLGGKTTHLILDLSGYFE